MTISDLFHNYSAIISRLCFNAEASRQWIIDDDSMECAEDRLDCAQSCLDEAREFIKARREEATQNA